MAEEKKPLFSNDEKAPAPKTGSTSKVEDLAAIKAKAKKRVRKPGSGRPKGSAMEAKAEKEAEAETARAAEFDHYRELFDHEAGTKNLLEWLFDTLSVRMGPWWKLKKEESAAGAKVVNSLVLKYSPAFAKYAEEAALGIWLLSTVGPRYMRTQDELAKIAAAQGDTDTRPAAEILAEEKVARSEPV